MMSKYWREILGIGLCITGLSAQAADCGKAVGLCTTGWFQEADCEDAVSFVEGYYESLNNNQVKDVLSKWHEPQNPKKLREIVSNVEYACLGTTKLKSCANGKASVYVEVVVKSKTRDAERWKGRITLLDSDEEWKINSMGDLKKVPGKVDEEPGC